MYNSVATEGRLKFDFHLPWEKFDAENCQGLKAVDFIVESDKYLYFIEVKDYEHPKAPKENQERDRKMLIENDPTFPRDMGIKIKDSLLRRYAQAKHFSKDVVFLLIINISSFTGYECERLYNRFNGHIPTGLNDSKYKAFSSIFFDLVLLDELHKKYGFDVTIAAIENNQGAAPCLKNPPSTPPN